MNASNHKPTIEGMTPPALSAQARRPTAAPVFKPEFARSLRMHPVIAAVVGVVVFLFLFGSALRQKPVYEAESLVYIEPESAKLIADAGSGLFDATRYDSFLQQQMQTAQRLDIVTAAVRSLPAGTWQDPGESEQAAALRLQNSVKTQRVNTSYQISFTLRGENAQKAAATLNAVVAAYLQAGRDDVLVLSEQRAQILGEEKQRITTELDAARTEQAHLSASLGMASPGMDVGNPYDTELVGIRTELAAARQSHDVAAAQLASVSGVDSMRASGLSAAADEIIAGDAGLSSMKSTISQRRATLQGQMAGLTPENPVYKQDQDEIADLDRSVDSMSTQLRDKAARRLQDKLRAELSRTGDIEARLNAQLAQQTSAATSASPRLQRATELTLDITRLMKRYADVDDALRSLQLETSGPGMARLVLPATPPVFSLPSRKRLLLLASLPLAIMLGAFAAVLARKRDPHVYIGKEVEDLLGFPPIAVLPAVQDVSAYVMQEYTLRLAGGVENAYRSSGARTFVLTSASPSTDVHALGISLEERLRQLGLDVVTVTASQMMDSEFRQSFQGEAQSMELMQVSGKPDGVAPANLALVKESHNVIFIDSPPLLTSAETEYMVRCSDATILVACSGATLRTELVQSALLLERLNVRGVAAVLGGLELRHASASFRKAVNDLDRRQFDSVIPGSAKRRSPEPVPVPASSSPAQEEAPLSVTSPEPVTPLEPEIDQASHLTVAHEPAIETTAVPAPVPAQAPISSYGVEQEPVPAVVTRAQPVVEIVPEEPARAAQPLLSAKSRSIAPSQEATKISSWFKRLFQQQTEPVSIIPKDEEEDQEQFPDAPVVSRAVTAIPDLIPAVHLDSVAPEPFHLGPVPAAAPDEPVQTVEIVEASLPEIPEQQPVTSKPVPAFTSAAEPEALRLDAPMSEPLPSLSRLAEPSAEEALELSPEPVPAFVVDLSRQMPPPYVPVTAAEAPSPPVDESLTGSVSSTQHPIPPTSRFPEPFLPSQPDLQPFPGVRPANRWEPIPTLRGEQLPWRNISGAQAAVALDTKRTLPPPHSARLLVPTPMPQPERIGRESHREPRLTRQWGLLSRFEQADPAGLPEDADHGIRSYRRS